MNNIIKASVSTTMIALLAACANFSGIQSDVALRQVSSIASDESLPGQQGLWPTLDWATDIGGSALQALITEALAANPTLQIAAARVNAATAMEQSARAAAGPTVGASLSSTYQRYTENGIIPPPLAGQYRSDNQLALNFAYDFDFWGRHAAALRSAQAQEQAAQAEQYATRLVLASAVARGWVQLARQQGQWELTRQQLAARQRIDQLTQRRFAAGLDTQSDNEQARLLIASLSNEQALWQEAISMTRNQLAALLGQGPDRGLRIMPGQLPVPVALNIGLPDALPAGLLGRRPDIVAARWRVEAAQGEFDAGKAQFYPNVNLMAFAGFSSLGLSNLLQAGSGVVGIGPAIRLPVFENGALRAQLKGRVAAYDGAVGAYNQALTDALHDVADQVSALRSIGQQDAHSLTATTAAANSLQLARERERIGTTNMLPVLAAEIALLSQQKMTLDLQARRSESRIGLIKALGGGYSEQSSFPKSSS